MGNESLWTRFQTYYQHYDSIGMSLDISRMNFPPEFIESMKGPMIKAFESMAALEKGAIANPDENRMVGHYWLRAPELAPTPELSKEISDTLASIKSFAAEVHAGRTKPQKASTFSHILSIGIGGSALGPEFVADALGQPTA